MIRWLRMSVDERWVTHSEAMDQELLNRYASGDMAASKATDQELLNRYASGEEAAFATLVTRHTPMVIGVCRRLLSSMQDAEDACQATFLVLARKAKSSRWQPSIANWLYTTARKIARNARTSADRRVRRETAASQSDQTEPVDRMTRRELLLALDDEVNRLPGNFREPLVLCYLEGLTFEEAAERLGIPVGTVKSRTARARKQLHEALTKTGWMVRKRLPGIVSDGIEPEDET